MKKILGQKFDIALNSSVHRYLPHQLFVESELSH